MNTDKLLEFDQIRTKWKSFALTTAAADRIDHMTYYLNESELRKQLQDTTDARNLIECCGIPPLTEAEHVKQILARAVKEGCLTPEQLEEMKNLLTAVRRLKDYLSKGRQHENALAWYEQNLDALEPLREEIAVTIRGGEVDDYASKQLQQIRAEMTRIREKIKQKAEQAIRANKPYLADAYCTIRSGHVCIPVKKEYKGKIKGSVIDQSATGNTLFMEPAAVCSLQETIQMLELEEEQEVSRILYTLTAMAADYEPEITEDIRIMEKLDFIFSKGKLSIDMDAVAANINTDRQIRLKSARHPLLTSSLSTATAIPIPSVGSVPEPSSSIITRLSGPTVSVISKTFLICAENVDKFSVRFCPSPISHKKELFIQISASSHVT